MAFILENDPIDTPPTYTTTYSTQEELDELSDFCPMCEIPDTYATPSGNKPIAQLHKVVSDIQTENRLSPAGFVRFVAKYYSDKTQPQLTNVLHWQNKVQTILNHPNWSLAAVYSHFSTHIADPWLSRQEALRQTNVMLRITGNTCLMGDGPPNPNTIKTFVELNKLRESLTVHTPKEFPGK